MLYVSDRTSFLLRRLTIGVICFCANYSSPAFGENAPVGTFVLTDEEIARRCDASIKGKIDMVDADDGTGTGATHRVPRCVATYENMRGIAQEFADAEEQAKRDIVAKTTVVECHGQDGCMAAAKRINDAAAEVHGNLVKISHDGESRLAEITHHEAMGVAEPIVATKPTAGDARPTGWGVADPIVNAVRNATGIGSDSHENRNPASGFAPAPGHAPEAHKPAPASDTNTEHGFNSGRGV